MAAGEGTRMRPHSLKLPKPLMPGNGKSLLQHQIEFLRLDVKKILVTVGYMGSKVKDAAYELGADEVLDIGNGGNASWLMNEKIRTISTPILVLTSDNLMQVDLGKLEIETENSKSIGTIVGVTQHMSKVGNFIKHSEGKILSMNSPMGHESLLASGLQVIVPSNIPITTKGLENFEEVWQLLIAINGLYLSKLHPTKWSAIDTFDELQNAILSNLI